MSSPDSSVGKESTCDAGEPGLIYIYYIHIQMYIHIHTYIHYYIHIHIIYVYIHTLYTYAYNKYLIKYKLMLYINACFGI